jgi:hypothetical protein
MKRVLIVVTLFVAGLVPMAIGGGYEPVRLAHAGTITSVEPGGTFDLSGITGRPSNDDFIGGAAAPNSIGGTKTFTTNASMLHKFNVDRSGGTTEYFFAELISNRTGVDWLDFHFRLTGNGGLDFDTDPDPRNTQRTPAPTSTGTSDPKNNFSRLNHQPGSIDWSGGLVKNGGSVFFTFSIDVPDSISSFTLQETPSAVPEPTTLLLFATTAAGLGWARRRQRRRKAGAIPPTE